MNITWPYTLGAAILIAMAIFSGGYLKGRADGKVEQLQATIHAYETRKEIDADVAISGRYDRCLELGGLPVDCEQLRGLDQTP